MMKAPQKTFFSRKSGFSEQDIGLSAYNILLVLILLLVLAYFAIFNLVDGTGQW